MNILKRKRAKYVLYGLGLLMLAGVIFTGLDYKKYRDYQQSQFFGSQAIVAQDQPLYFDDLKYEITDIKQDPYDNRKILDIKYSITNVSSEAIQINDYEARIVGTEDTDIFESTPSITGLLAQQTRQSTFELIVPRDTKQLALVVTNASGESKSINIALP